MTAQDDRDNAAYRAWSTRRTTTRRTQTAKAATDWAATTRALAANTLAGLPADPDADQHRAATNQEEPT